MDFFDTLKDKAAELKGKASEALEKTDIDDKIKAGAAGLKDKIEKAEIGDKIKDGAAGLKDKIEKAEIGDKIKDGAAGLKNKAASVLEKTDID
ncbi:MAG: hypothetical protein IIY84_05915, partial [Eubacterium sp.]|nr:hypothetical protein [Eubacterium sp.]